MPFFTSLTTPLAGVMTQAKRGPIDMHRNLKITSIITCLVIVGCSSSDSPAVAINPMNAFGTTASNVFFYYDDVEAATTFYSEILGLRVTADYGKAKFMLVAPKCFNTLVDACIGMHSADEPKTTAIALVTDQLDEWWNYIGTQDVEMRTTEFAAREGGPHDGFIAIDPEGYLLEFERFNVHEENRKFTPLLNETDTLYPEPGVSNVPAGLGFKATIVWFYYKDLEGIQRFYEDVLGLELIVDQGWTKIYPVGPTGYFGLVDEQRGMHSYTEQKGVTLSLITANIDGWYDYLRDNNAVTMRSEEISEQDRYRAFVAYDPEGYYLEWDIFNDIPVNESLVGIINSK
jgi:catechol 2,3-dioxygenase-like lactoylglutathione lyase family enzyme